jgi:hypothetical protein
MRKILPFIFILLFGSTVFVALNYDGDARTFPEQLRDAMPFAEFDTYIDPQYGYSVKYPSFFDKEEVDEKKGNVRFSYRDNTNLVLEAEVKPKDFLHDKNALETIDSGSVERLDGYEFIRHCVRHEDHWYVLTFYFPANCKQGVERIVYQVKTWKPFLKKRF